jgi:hypothetical protein
MQSINILPPQIRSNLAIKKIMDKDLNLELRKEIIDIALHLEDAVNMLLISYLNIENLNLKALGNKNSSLSFKNKIDLLSDIEVFAKEEHFKFLLLMEFRNQFMHNSKCNSFTRAIEILGPDRGKQLLKHYTQNFDTDQEYKYKSSFNNLYMNCLEIAVRKYEQKYEMIEKKRKTLTDVAEYQQHIIDKDTEFFSEIFKLCEPKLNETIELLNFKMELVEKIQIFHKMMSTSEELINLQKRIGEMLDSEEKIRAFFK